MHHDCYAERENRQERRDSEKDKGPWYVPVVVSEVIFEVEHNRSDHKRREQLCGTERMEYELRIARGRDLGRVLASESHGDLKRGVFRASRFLAVE